MPVASLDQVSIAYGHLPLLDRVNFQIEPRERVCLIGRNGTGKSTLLQILAGHQPPDAGAVWRQPGVRVARLVQDVTLDDDRSVFEVVAEGLGEVSALATAYHQTAVALEHDSSPELLDKLGRLQHELEEHDGWQLEQRIELVLSRLGLAADARVTALSGGWRRRVLLARTLVGAPDLLLLDEPTNHLDIEAISWLETFLVDYPGAIVFITHDRTFLQRVATRIVELDRGRLSSWPGTYDNFLQKKEEWLANESVRQEKFDKRLAEEEVWLRQGIKARRTRNEGRVRALMAMRVERAARREQMGSVRLQIERADSSGRLVFEAEHVSKAFGETVVLRDFSTMIMRGDRIGLIGANGTGKTTLLRLLLDDLAPDAGEIRRGTNVQIAYYDQQREQLDPERTVADTVGDGNDTVTVNGESRHVHGYLRDFLFPAERARSPVKALSGGERNRLLLARLFTRQANVLVLDEPTNDLDLETLELLEAQLVDWPGTLLLVSHDRAFLDNIVTSTIAFEGEGRVEEYVGGYTDWVRQRSAAAAAATAAASASSLRMPAAAIAPAPAAIAHVARPTSTSAPRSVSRKPGASAAGAGGEPDAAAAAKADKDKKRLTYNERRELERLPTQIEALESEQQRLETAMASPGFYKELSATIAQTLARLEAVRGELTGLYTRWDELDSRTVPRETTK
jgi:ATP-binding cassette subfamily F protein uup